MHYLLQGALRVGWIIAHQRTGYHGFLPGVQTIHFSRGYIELAVQPGQQWLDPAAFLLQGSTSRDLQVKSQ